MLLDCPAGLKERFRITGRLGAGGMGTVHAGTHPGTGRPCAVKVLHAGSDERDRRRFLREARMMARLRHPALIEVLDCGEEDGVPWLAIERIDGHDLASLPPEVEVDAELFGRVALGVARALEALHQEGIVHRDVKPNNVMLDGSGRVVLMDLGLARDVTSTQLTRTGAVVGTPGYMAPERVLGDPAGPPSDAYALGATLYALLSGHAPYRVEQILAMTARGEWLPPEPLPEPLAGGPEERLILSLLEPDPVKRPTALAAVESYRRGHGDRSDDFDPLTTSLDASASLPGPAPGLRAPRRRRHSWWMPAAVLLVAAGTWWTLRSRQGPPPPGVPASSTSTPPAAPSTRVDPPHDGPLTGICRTLGLSVRDPPVLTLATLRLHPESEVASRAVELLAALPGDPAATYLRLLLLGRVGRLEEELALARGVDLVGEVPDYWSGRVRIQALDTRLPHDCPAAAGADSPVARRLVADTRALEERLRARSDPAARVLRAELWELLARRAFLRPKWHLGALEFADRLLHDLVPELPTLPLELRAMVSVPLGRITVWLGEKSRHELQYQRLSGLVLEELEDPAVRGDWSQWMQEEARHRVGAEGLAVISDFLQLEHDPAWLPIPPGFPGSVPRGERVDPVTVPDPWARPPRALDLVEPRPLEVAESAERATLEGVQLTASEAWLRRHLLEPARRGEGPLLETVQSWPDLVVPLAGMLRGEGTREGERRSLELLRELKRRQRSSELHLARKRGWYRGAWARFHLALVSAELEGPEPRRGLVEARRILEVLAELPGPWVLDEVELTAGLWATLRAGLHPDGSCPALDREVLRTGLLALEARARAGRHHPVAPSLDAPLLGRVLAPLEAGGERAGECAEALPPLGMALPAAWLPAGTRSDRARLEALGLRR